MSDAGRPLTSPIYLSALALLLANDWILKATLHNALTGKLSDVAGMFAITFFAAALFPRYRAPLGMGIALAFVYWKSPHSDGLIATWNGLGLFPVGRVVDTTDCVALATVPAALVQFRRIRADVLHRIPVGVVAVISLLAFTATTYGTVDDVHEYDRSYSFSLSASELRERVNAVSLLARKNGPIGILDPEELVVGVPDSCGGWVYATIRIEEAPAGSKLRLFQIESGCLSGEGEKTRVLERFEADFVEKLDPEP